MIAKGHKFTWVYIAKSFEIFLLEFMATNFSPS